MLTCLSVALRRAPKIFTLLATTSPRQGICGLTSAITSNCTNRRDRQSSTPQRNGTPTSSPCRSGSQPVTSPSKIAIRNAEAARQRAIVFFAAAAANNGANSEEMVPAYLDSVISVRGTDHNGSFFPAYNPPPTVTNSSSPLYGTLGVDVPCCWPFTVPLLYCSCFFTPVLIINVSIFNQKSNCRTCTWGCLGPPTYICYSCTCSIGTFFFFSTSIISLL